MTPDDEIAAALAAEMERKTTPMEVVYHPATVFQLTGLLQLALRHPHVQATVGDAARRFIDGARQYFADSPTVLDVIEKGDDPAQDRPRSISPRGQIAEMQTLIAAGWQVFDDPAKIAARYKDRDLADQVPRPVMYFDIGVLLGLLDRKLARDPADALASLRAFKTALRKSEL